MNKMVRIPPDNEAEELDRLRDGQDGLGVSGLQPDRATRASPQAPAGLGHSAGIADAVPEWNISPSPFDWQVMIYGGVNPRNGIEWLPLEFQFFGPHYSRRDIFEKAADLCEREHRQWFQVRPPSDRRFLKHNRKSPRSGQRAGNSPPPGAGCEAGAGHKQFNRSGI